MRLIFLGLTLVSLLGLIGEANGATSVTTEPAIGIGDNDAIVRGTVNPGGQLTRVWFEWGKGSKLNQTTFVQTLTGGYNSITVQALVFDLEPETTYSYRTVARDVDGIWTGEIRRFTTEDSKSDFRRIHQPNVYTEPAMEISHNRASMRGRIELEGRDDPRRDPNTEAWFEWGEDPQSLSKRTSRQPVGGDGYVIRFSDNLNDLNPNTSYYYRAVAKNFADTSHGQVTRFTTTETPFAKEPFESSVQILSVERLTSDAAALKGRVNPHSGLTTAWFEWGTNANNLINRTGAIEVGAGNSFINISSFLTGLSPNTPYYYRAVAVNPAGTSFSSIGSFRTNTISTPIAPAAPEAITRVVRVVERETAVAATPAEQGIKFTLEADKSDKSEISKDKIVYLINYKNLTNRVLRGGTIEVSLPEELEFVDSDRRVDEERDSTLVFKLGTIRGGEQDKIEIETEGVDLKKGDRITVTASLSYLNGNNVKYIVSATDVTEFTEEDTAGGLTATVPDALKNFFTNPILWLLIVLTLVYLAYRFLARRRAPLIYPPVEGEVPSRVYPPPLAPPVPSGPVGGPLTVGPPPPPRPPEPPPFG